MTNLSVFIIAGGKSSRMGEDKAFVRFGNSTLLAHMVALARSIVDDVTIVGSPSKYAAYGRVIPDIFPDRGPLAGIHAALRNTGSELNLALAVDMPFVENGFLTYLVEQAFATTAMVTVPHVCGHFQPLCAAYRRSFAVPAEDALTHGKNKIDLLFAPGVTRVITQEEIERLAFPAAMFDNLNTRDDLQRARTRIVHE